MKARDIAIGIIEARFNAMAAGDDGPQLSAEASMAVEMAYALGAIDCVDHRRYVERQMRMTTRSTERLLEKMRRCA